MKRSLWRLSSLLLLLALLPLPGISQVKTVVSDVFVVRYSENLQQPLEIQYKVQCPTGTASRSGLSWSKPRYINTSDNDDYKNNVWDRGHLAPAAAFACDKKTIKKTFTYLNCALQHEGLNRGPWKELEGFERDLGKLFKVAVVIEVDFAEEPERVPGGAAIPRGFYKTIFIKDHTWKFYFPNEDVAGQDWFDFIIIE